jgi:8-oxo-dGTP pyrophosphatase MutT (NUDIX family)
MSRALPKIPRDLPQNFQGLSSEIEPWQATDARSAAVAFLFWLGGAEGAQIVLTRRTLSVRSHKGQIAFAGGRRDPEDADPFETAKREATEELGLTEFSFVGTLPRLQSLDGSSVVPVVMTTPQKPQIELCSSDEVAELFLVPWKQLQLSAAEIVNFVFFGVSRTTPVFRLPRGICWGLTGHIIAGADLR